MPSVLAWGLLCVLIGLTVWALVKRARYMWQRPRCAERADIWSYPFRTGDLILTSARWSPREDLRLPLRRRPSFTKTVTASVYNHVAIAYVDERTGQPLFWEMTQGGTRMATLYDMTCGRPHQDVVVRPLNAPVDQRLFEEVVASQWRYVFDYDVGLNWYHRYAHEMRWLPLPFLKGRAWGRGMQRTCVHTAAEMYAALGVLDFSASGVNPATLFAADFGREPIDRGVLPLSNGYEFGPPVFLDFNESRDHLPIPSERGRSM